MEHKQQKSLNEAIQRVVLGIIQESSSHSIKDYTLKLKKKKVKKYDDVDIDDDVTIYHYDILLNKKVVGEIREDDRTGDGYGKLHGKNLPGGYGGGGVDAFHAFLRSKLFQKWSKNVKFFKDNPLSGLGESVEEQRVVLGEAEKKLGSLSDDAKSLLASAINMGSSEYGGPYAEMSNLEYFTPEAFARAMEFMSKNKSKLSKPAMAPYKELVKFFN